MFLGEGVCQSVHVLCWEGVMPVSSCMLVMYLHRETVKWLNNPSGAEAK